MCTRQSPIKTECKSLGLLLPLSRGLQARKASRRRGASRQSRPSPKPVSAPLASAWSKQVTAKIAQTWSKHAPGRSAASSRSAGESKPLAPARAERRSQRARFAWRARRRSSSSSNWHTVPNSSSNCVLESSAGASPAQAEGSAGGLESARRRLRPPAATRVGAALPAAR